MKNLFSCRQTVAIPAGSKLYINFYEQDLPDPGESQSIMLKIEFGNMPNVLNRDLFGKDPAHLEVYGPFDEVTQCKITYNSTNNNRNMRRLRNRFKIGLYERQMVLPLGICGNINRL